MNRRRVIIGLLCLLCLVSFWAVLAQQRAISHLRAEQKSLLASMDASDAAVLAGPVQTAPNEAPLQTASPELLRLRAQVTALNQRRRELDGVEAQNQRLQAEVAAMETNSPGFVAGYIKKADAQFAGFRTPEATMQTFLWALQHQDLTNFFRALTPQSARLYQSRPGLPPLDPFRFERIRALFGMGIVSQRKLSDSTVGASIQFFPKLPPENVDFQQIDGDWKMNLPF